MKWSWLLILTLIVGILQIISGYLTATKQTNYEKSNKLTKAGKLIVFIMFFSGIVNIISHLIDSYNNAQESKKNEKITKSILDNTDRINDPFSPFNLTVVVSIPFYQIKNRVLIDSLKIIKDSIENRFDSWSKFDLTQISATRNKLETAKLNGNKEKIILDQIKNPGKLTFYFYDHDTTGLGFDSLIKKSDIIEVTHPNGNVSYEEDKVKKSVLVLFEHQEFYIITIIPNIKILRFSHIKYKKSLQGLSDLINQYLFIAPSGLEGKMEFKYMSIETGKDFSKIFLLGQEAGLTEVSIPPSKNKFYVHRFSRTELMPE